MNEKQEYFGKKPNKRIVDKTNIDKINGYYFCYKYKSYRRLLYNNQIKKSAKM